MARTVEITLYKLDELDEAVQRRVIEGWRNNETFPWDGEWRDSLDAFEKVAPIKVRDWSVGYPGTYVTFDIDEDVANLSGMTAYRWLVQDGWEQTTRNQDCPFTGYCGDENLLDAIRAGLANPSSIASLRDLFHEALHDWAKGYEADFNYWHSEEAIREDIDANGYEFHADGTLAR
jgi:hypothetical protein